MIVARCLLRLLFDDRFRALNALVRGRQRSGGKGRDGIRFGIAFFAASNPQPRANKQAAAESRVNSRVDLRMNHLQNKNRSEAGTPLPAE
ncbi:MAG: hypothetical protein U0Y68_19075 [Blastocatellia bacterium]